MSASNFEKVMAKLDTFERRLDDARKPADPQMLLPAEARDAGRDSYGFKTPKDFLNCVIKAYTRPHDRPDRRLSQLSTEAIRKAQEANGVVVKAAGSDEATGINDPYGGFLVPPVFSPELLKVDPEADPMAGKTRAIPMAGPSVKINARVDKNHSTSVSGGLTVTRRPETVAGNPTRIQFEQIALEAHSLFGLSYATEELLMDSPISFAALLEAGFSDQFTYHLVKERVSGTGVGEFLGVLNSPCLVSVAKESGQPADTIVYENILAMRARCWGYGKAIWIANHDTMPSLMKLNQAVGTGGMVMWQPSAREDHPDLLLGRPLIFSEYAKTVGDAGDIILGNWGEYLEGVYQPLQNDMSIHVRFDRHERCFKFWTRNAGQPWWRSALTPANGANTLSPFVVISERA